MSRKLHRTSIALKAALLLSIVALAGCGSGGDSNVSGALATLLTQHHVQHGPIVCAHISGTSYQCAVTQGQVQREALVTDDGHSIVERGIAP